MHKFPAGSILIFFPASASFVLPHKLALKLYRSLAVWGYLLGAHADKPDYIRLTITLAALLVWGTLLHGAGCVINDICDVDFDRRVGELSALFCFYLPFPLTDAHTP